MFRICKYPFKDEKMFQFLFSKIADPERAQNCVGGGGGVASF